MKVEKKKSYGMPKQVLICGLALVYLFLLWIIFEPDQYVYGADVGEAEVTVTAKEKLEESESAPDIESLEAQILDKIDMDAVEQYSNDYVPDKLSFKGIVNDLLNQDEKSGEKICQYIYELFFYEIGAVRPLVINALCYTIIFMIISRLVFWEKDYVYNISFLFMYASVMVMLLSSFFVLADVAKKCINVLLTYLTALVPAYAAVLVMSGNGFSAAGFYVFTFILIYVVEWLIKIILIPGIHAFLVLETINHVFEEEKLGKLAELIEAFIIKIMKASIKIVAGIGIVQAMIAPAKDRISESLILKSFSAIPGVGQLGQGAGEIMLGCAMLIKNSVGMAAIVVLGFIVLTPLVKTLVFSIMYRLLAAVLQPVSDGRIVEGIGAVARAGNLYYVVIRDASILFFIVIAIICASTSFIK